MYLLRLAFILCMVLMAMMPAGAGAYESDAATGAGNPVVRFTRSLAQLDRVSGLCQDIQSARYETYSLLIRKYIRNQYEGDVPYWVLSEVKSRVTDQATCKWMVSESLVHYQYAYQEYVEVTKPRVPPPRLTESMAQYGAEGLAVDTLGIARPSKH